MAKRKDTRDTRDLVHAEPNLSKRHKTAIEQEMEEAEAYERRKESEQRRAQQLKMLSLDGKQNSAKETVPDVPEHHDDA